ncbi:MAG: ATP-binding protein, partial [Calditrichaceae bacterium]
VVYDNNIKKFLVNAITESLITSKIFPGRIYAGTGDGLIVIQKQKNRFKVEYTFETPDYVDAIVEEKDGGLWLGGDFLGLFHVSGDMKALSDGIDKDVNFDYYNKQNGLPGETWKIFEVQNKMLLATELGVFAFDEETQRFIPDSTLGDNISGPQNTISLIEKSTDNNLWIISQQNGKNELGKAFLQKDGRYKWNPIPEFRRLELGSSTAVYSDYDEKSKNEILWISTKDALVRYNPDIKNNIRINYSTLIRKVSVEDDSLIYGGAPRSGKANNSSILPFSSNNINFYFSAVSFDKPEDTRYQYFLDGNDEEWSKWTSDSKKNYTNLSGGTYTFRVRSKNGYGTTGREDFFHFTVLPPWYLTWWAYTLYGLMVLAGVFAADRIGRRIVIRNERDRAKLREAELVKKQAEELETVDKLVRVINKADDLETLFKSLLERTISFIPQAEKAALFLRDHDKNLFRVAYTSGYQVDDLSNISFLPEELKNRYTVNSEEIEERIYIVSKTGDLPGDEKFISFKKANSMLVMAVEWENELEAYVVFDSFSESKAFDLSAARILNRFRVHAVSAISKARSLKMLQEKTEKIIKTQEQLVTQEKLASLGQLTAGIAHEIKNPLNFVINFAGISSELLQELQQVLESQKDKISLTSWAEIDDIIKTLEENSAKINEHGKRADNIVRSMLQHSRGKLGERRATDINAMLEENISFAFHSFRAQDISFNITIEKDFDSSVGKPDVVPQDLSRVFLNIIQNAFYAASPSKPKGNNDVNSEQKALSDKIIAEHARLGSSPTIWIKTKNLGNKIEIRIGDNGPGIPKEIHDKIFNPFFSTKSSGEGTGLGLSIAYDIIVKEHGGEIRFESTEYEFTEFIISLPNLNGSKT